MTMREKIQLFEGMKVRTAWDSEREKWYFSIVDVCGVLTDQPNYDRAKNYWKVLKFRIVQEGNELVANCNQLKLVSPKDGKRYLTDVADAEQLFRIVQSIPSPKAEPFKQWLARVGYERIQEIENPELAQERMKAIYEAKGYPKDWIDKRLRGIAIRQNLTNEWKERGITEQRDYAILTAEIAKATFGMTPSEHEEIKGLTKKSQNRRQTESNEACFDCRGAKEEKPEGVNLRDHMTDLELIFTMLGERVTTEVSQKEKPEGMRENVKVAQRGGSVAGVARKAAEKEIGHSVVSQSNFLDKNPDSILIGGVDEE
ncbi:MAG: Bro-N domain-containing protein [bacterium]|nr:Bro-N domain-containing protein [Candidatus Limimorpha caballi]